MTVPATARRAGPYNGNGSTTSFSFSFKTFAAGDLQVTRTSATGLESVLVLNSDYSVTLNPDQDASPGGTITYPISGAALAIGEKLTIVGDLEYDQTTDLLGGGAFNARVIEDTLDRIVIQIQQLEERLDRALSLPVSAAASTVLPVPSANKVIAWDSAAGALVNRDAGDFASAVAYANWRTDVFSGTGLATQFTLAADPGNVNNMDVAIGGVSQAPNADYAVSGTTLTFTSAPPAGTSNIVVRYGQALPVGTANASQVTFDPAGTGAQARTAQDKLRDEGSVKDYGAIGNGSASDNQARTFALAALKYAFYPTSASFYPVTSWTGTGGATGSVNMHPLTWEADESHGNQGTIRVRRNTSTSKDAVFAEHFGTGTGYAVHGISYANTGSGMGGACWGVGAGVVGNKRGSGAGSVGNGVYGAAGIDNGNDQTGVFGLYSGTGTGGTGVAGKNESSGASGVGGFFWRTGGGGAAAYALKDGAGDGQGVLVERKGSGNGDALQVDFNSSGTGQAVTGVRKNGSGTTFSLGYLGYFDGTESIGVYGYAPAGGTTQWGGRFDGNTNTTGYGQFGGGVRPSTDNGANCGESGRRWSAVYAVNGTIQTSDGNEKQDIVALTAAELRVGVRLKALVRKFRFRDAVQAKGDAARIHIGVIAQDVEAAFKAEALDPDRYGVFCKDTITRADGTTFERRGVRYDQVFAFVVAAL